MIISKTNNVQYLQQGLTRDRKHPHVNLKLWITVLLLLFSSNQGNDCAAPAHQIHRRRKSLGSCTGSKLKSQRSKGNKSPPCLESWRRQWALLTGQYQGNQRDGAPWTGCFVFYDKARRGFYLKATFENSIFSLLCVAHRMAKRMTI